MLLSITAFSQVEIVENFDTTANNQVPAGWSYTNNFRASTNFACGGSGSAATVGITAGNSATLTTANYSAITNATDLTVSFSVNVFEQFSQFPPPSFLAPATGWGSLVLEYSIDGGTNWIVATTVNDSNFTYTATDSCVDIAPINLGALTPGTDFQARFVATAVNVTNFALILTVDNISITQVATTVPNCDAVLTNPLNGSNTADLDTTLTWSNATGLPTGYNVSVGTSMGGTEIVNAAFTNETSYSLDGLGLAYETVYYVTIVPSNSFGSATGCTEETFTTRSEPIDGATCGSPLVIASLPYIMPGGDTADYENNINVSPCNNTYMNGNDVFYEFTPVTDVSINIDLANIDNNGPSIHVLNDCPDSATECIAFVGTFNSGGTLNLSEVVLLAGNSYFIVLSNSSSSRTYTYDLIITQNSCINPEFTLLAPITDCDNGQFSVDVDVTYLGDASSLTLTDDFGNSNNSISTTGIVSLGSYPSGSTVNFTLTSNDDNTCSFANSTYFYCPPANDDCANSIDLTSTINTDGTCTLVTSATNAGATDSTGDPAACSGNTNDVWFSFVANGSAMVMEIFNVLSAPGTPSGGIIQSIELLEGSCGSLTSLGCYSSGFAQPFYYEFQGLTDGNTYYIRDKSSSAGEYAQNFDICLKTVPAAPANDECSNATVLTLSTDDQCDNQASGTTIGATVSADNNCNTTILHRDVWYVFTPVTTGIYEFSYERIQTSPASNYTIYEGTCGALVQKSSSCTSTTNQIFTLNGGESYYIMVRSATNSGAGHDFNLCVWQLPPAVANSDCNGAEPILESPDSNGANTISSNLDNSYNSPEGCSSATYESVWYSFTPQYTGSYNFDFTRVGGSAYYAIFNTDSCANTSDGYVTGSCYNSADVVGDVVAGNTYLIMVHASAAAGFELFIYPDPSLSVESTVFETFKYYPNPVVNTLTLEAKNTISKVTVHNIVGQQVQVVTPNNLKSTVNLNSLKSGVYFVTITIDGAQKTIRIIKN